MSARCARSNRRRYSKNPAAGRFLDTPLADVCATVAKRRIHRVVITDADGCLAGIVSTIDLVKRFEEVLRQA